MHIPPFLKKGDIIGITASARKISSEKLDQHVEKDIKQTEKVIKESFLYKKNIAISVSDSEDIEVLGFSKIHQEDMVLEITRYLIINGATLIYGGDLRAQGYTFLFSEINKRRSICY